MWIILLFTYLDCLFHALRKKRCDIYKTVLVSIWRVVSHVKKLVGDAIIIHHPNRVQQISVAVYCGRLPLHRWILVQ